MAIAHFGQSISVADAGVAIRGSNTSTNGGTDFKSARSRDLLRSKELSLVDVSNLESMKQQLTAGRPVIVLLNNYRYREPSGISL